MRIKIIFLMLLTLVLSGCSLFKTEKNTLNDAALLSHVSTQEMFDNNTNDQSYLLKLSDHDIQKQLSDINVDSEKSVIVAIEQVIKKFDQPKVEMGAVFDAGIQVYKLETGYAVYIFSLYSGDEAGLLNNFFVKPDGLVYFVGAVDNFDGGLKNLEGFGYYWDMKRIADERENKMTLRDEKVWQDAKKISTALEIFFNENDTYPIFKDRIFFNEGNKIIAGMDHYKPLLPEVYNYNFEYSSDGKDYKLYYSILGNSDNIKAGDYISTNKGPKLIKAYGVGLSDGSNQDNSSQNKDDRNRISDIKQVQTGLELFYYEHKQYPVMSNPVFLGKDCPLLKVKNFSNYLNTLPADSGGHQYIYVSNGKKYEIFFQLDSNVNQLKKGFYKAIPSGIENLPVDIYDKDQDGLVDSLEDYYQTDKNNKDTDQDGYLDGEEVMNGYNPVGTGKIY